MLVDHFLDLVGSTLSDPYLSYSAALFALAGPLHGYVIAMDYPNTPYLNHTLSRLQSCESGSPSMAARNASRDWRQRNS